jgi:hypothetical protein
MFRSIYFLFVLSIFILSNKSDVNLYCSNGRQALWTFNLTSFRFSTACPTLGQSCHNKIGICSDQNVCCPRTLK